MRALVRAQERGERAANVGSREDPHHVLTLHHHRAAVLVIDHPIEGSTAHDAASGQLRGGVGGGVAQHHLEARQRGDGLLHLAVLHRALNGAAILLGDARRQAQLDLNAARQVRGRIDLYTLAQSQSML